MRVILIIEDDPDPNILLRELLEGEGYFCIATLSGSEGLRLLIEEKPDLVLLDLHLLGMSGAEFLEHKAAAPALAEIPVIVMTGLARTPELDGIAAVLWKPFAPEELLELVRKFAPAKRLETA